MDLPLLTQLLPQRKASRFLGYNALFWLASAIVHFAIFIGSDTPWTGSISWRKPVVFSLSFALMIWAFAWALDRLPDKPKMAQRLAVVFAASSAIELLLIIGQQWRGRPSHFSFEGTDAMVFGLMGTMVAVISIAILTLFGWAIRRPPANQVDRLALFGGLFMITLGLGFGQWLVTLGNAYVEQFNQVPEALTSGDAGVAKFPHGVAFHGMQAFMVAAALLRNSGVDKAKAIRLMATVVVSYNGILLFSALQSIGGRAPLELNVISSGLLFTSLAVFAASFALIVIQHQATKSGPARREPTLVS